jgi:hypothetical protein
LESDDPHVQQAVAESVIDKLPTTEPTRQRAEIVTLEAGAQYEADVIEALRRIGAEVDRHVVVAVRQLDAIAKYKGHQIGVETHALDLMSLRTWHRAVNQASELIADGKPLQLEGFLMVAPSGKKLPTIQQAAWVGPRILLVVWRSQEDDERLKTAIDQFS